MKESYSRFFGFELRRSGNSERSHFLSWVDDICWRTLASPASDIHLDNSVYEKTKVPSIIPLTKSRNMYE
jgi:hypothetical protein